MASTNAFKHWLVHGLTAPLRAIGRFQAWVGATVQKIPGWSEIDAAATQVTWPLRRLAAWALVRVPLLQRYEWLFETERLAKYPPVMLAATLLFMLYRGLSTTNLGHIGTDSLIYPSLAIVSGFNPFLGGVSALCFGAGDLAQKLVINDIYGTPQDWIGHYFNLDYWGSIIGYVFSYSAPLLMGVLPGLTSRLARQAVRVGLRKIFYRQAAAAADGAQPPGDDAPVYRLFARRRDDGVTEWIHSAHEPGDDWVAQGDPVTRAEADAFLDGIGSGELQVDAVFPEVAGAAEHLDPDALRATFKQPHTDTFRPATDEEIAALGPKGGGPRIFEPPRQRIDDTFRPATTDDLSALGPKAGGHKVFGELPRERFDYTYRLADDAELKGAPEREGFVYRKPDQGELKATREPEGFVYRKGDQSELKAAREPEGFVYRKGDQGEPKAAREPEGFVYRKEDQGEPKAFVEEKSLDRSIAQGDRKLVSHDFIPGGTAADGSPIVGLPLSVARPAPRRPAPAGTFDAGVNERGEQVVGMYNRGGGVAPRPVAPNYKDPATLDALRGLRERGLLNDKDAWRSVPNLTAREIQILGHLRGRNLLGPGNEIAYRSLLDEDDTPAVAPSTEPVVNPGLATPAVSARPNATRAPAGPSSGARPPRSTTPPSPYGSDPTGKPTYPLAELIASILAAAATGGIVMSVFAPLLEMIAFYSRINPDVSCYALEKNILQAMAPVVAALGGFGGPLAELLGKPIPPGGGAAAATAASPSDGARVVPPVPTAPTPATRSEEEQSQVDELRRRHAQQQHDVDQANQNLREIQERINQLTPDERRRFNDPNDSWGSEIRRRIEQNQQQITDAQSGMRWTDDQLAALGATPTGGHSGYGPVHRGGTGAHVAGDIENQRFTDAQERFERIANAAAGTTRNPDGSYRESVGTSAEAMRGIDGLREEIFGKPGQFNPAALDAAEDWWRTRLGRENAANAAEAVLHRQEAEEWRQLEEYARNIRDTAIAAEAALLGGAAGGWAGGTTWGAANPFLVNAGIGGVTGAAAGGTSSWLDGHGFAHGAIDGGWKGAAFGGVLGRLIPPGYNPVTMGAGTGAVMGGIDAAIKGENIFTGMVKGGAMGAAGGKLGHIGATHVQNGTVFRMPTSQPEFVGPVRGAVDLPGSSPRNTNWNQKPTRPATDADAMAPRQFTSDANRNWGHQPKPPEAPPAPPPPEEPWWMRGTIKPDRYTPPTAFPNEPTPRGWFGKPGEMGTNNQFPGSQGKGGYDVWSPTKGWTREGHWEWPNQAPHFGAKPVENFGQNPGDYAKPPAPSKPVGLVRDVPDAPPAAQDTAPLPPRQFESAGGTNWKQPPPAPPKPDPGPRVYTSEESGQWGTKPAGSKPIESGTTEFVSPKSDQWGHQPAKPVADEPLYDFKNNVDPMEHNPKLRTTKQDREDFKEMFGEGRYEDYAQHAEQAKANHPDFKDIPTEDLAALRGYTSSDYENINKVLRSGDKGGLEAYGPEIKGAVSALNELPNHNGTVFRGTDLTPEIAARYQPGEVVTERGFTSSSYDASKKFDGNTSFVIQSKTGKIVEPVSKFAHEKEVLFPPGTRFRVLDRVETGSKRTIILEEV